MIKEARGFGSTIDEAKENAIASLNASAEDDIQFEVVSTPKKKTLGLFGGSKAEVRVYIEMPDEKPKAAKKPVKKAEQKPVKNTPKPPKKAAPEKKPVPEKKQQPVIAEKPAPEKQKRQSENFTDGFSEPVAADKLEPGSRAAKAVAYLNTILNALGCTDVAVKVAEKENAALISLDGEGLGVIIGHRGETLDSVQYLTSLAANNGGGYYKVSINIGNYREKREQTLRELAARVSEQVLKTGRCRGLEPMNPYERRIIHTAVQDIDGVVSSSFGEGTGRRVVIGVEGGEMHPPRRDDRPYGSRDRGGRDRDRDRSHGGRERRPSNTVATAPSREPKKDSDIPLYGKIN